MNALPRRILRAAAAALLAASVFHGAPSFAPPMTGDPTKFREQMDAWQKETGRESNVSLYAAVGELHLPAWMNPSTMMLVQKAWQNPFEEDLAALESTLADFEPAFALMEKARGMEERGRFPEQLNSPSPNYPNLVATCQMLCCRAQIRARAGDLDGAIRDLTSVWIAGRSLEHEAGTMASVRMALALRGFASQQLNALVRKFNLSPEQRAELRSILVKDAQKDGESAALRAMLNDHGHIAQMVRESPLKQNAQLMDETAAEILAALQAFDEKSPHQRYAQLAEFEKVHEDAVKRYPAAASYSFPMRQTLVHENLTIAMERMTVVATLLLDANAAAEGGNAADEAVAAMAKEYPNQLVDPFTGEALLTINKGGTEIAVVSAGPDGKLSAPKRWAPYNPALGPHATGDIVLYRIGAFAVQESAPADAAAEETPAEADAPSEAEAADAPADATPAATPAAEAP